MHITGPCSFISICKMQTHDPAHAGLVDDQAHAVISIFGPQTIRSTVSWQKIRTRGTSIVVVAGSVESGQTSSGQVMMNIQSHFISVLSSHVTYSS